MAQHSQRPNSCKKIRDSIADAIRSANEEHQEENFHTFIRTKISPFNKKTGSFTVRCAVAFVKHAKKEDIDYNMRIVNTVNELILSRTATVCLIRGAHERLLGYPKNPFEVSYRVVNPGFDNGQYELNMVYSEDTQAINSGLTWDVAYVGKHIMDFLVKGILDGEDFPSQFIP